MLDKAISVASLFEGDHSSTLIAFKLKSHTTVIDELGEHPTGEV